jgi:hypothetical protein
VCLAGARLRRPWPRCRSSAPESAPKRRQIEVPADRQLRLPRVAGISGGCLHGATCRSTVVAMVANAIKKLIEAVTDGEGKVTVASFRRGSGVADARRILGLKP